MTASARMYTSTFKLLFLCLTISSEVCSKKKHYKNDYCVYNCKNVLHAACPQPCTNMKNCIFMPPELEFRRTILWVHNSVRNCVASGGHFHFDSASNMMALSYDMELEFIAYCWAEKNVYGYNTCARTQKFEHVGQNIAVLKENTADRDDLRTGIRKHWMEYSDYVDKYVIKSYRHSFVTDYSSFAQMINAETHRMGCSRCRRPNKTTFVTCYYAPPGKLEGKPIYKFGQAASMCPGNVTRNTVYPALCGRATMPEEGKHLFMEKGTRLKCSIVVACFCTTIVLALHHCYYKGLVD